MTTPSASAISNYDLAYLNENLDIVAGYAKLCEIGMFVVRANSASRVLAYETQLRYHTIALKLTVGYNPVASRNYSYDLACNWEDLLCYVKDTLRAKLK